MVALIVVLVRVIVIGFTLDEAVTISLVTGLTASAIGVIVIPVITITIVIGLSVDFFG
jgi:hypothetical protein